MGMLSIFNVTPIYAACLGLLYVGLSLNVVRLRWKYKTGIGSGGYNPLSRAIRAHGNCGEYAPLGIILLALTEVIGASDMTLHIIGACLLVGRILHATGLLKSAGTSAPRLLGMVLTFTSIIFSSAFLLIK